MHLARTAGPVATLAVVLLLSAQAATAQVPPLPGSRAAITLTVPPGPLTVAQGATASIDVSVSITIANMVCQGPGTATVNLAVKDVPTPMQGISTSLPSTVVFDIGGPMAYTDPGNGAYSGAAQTKKLNVTVAPGSAANHDHALNVTATFSASGLSSSCVPAGGSLDASASAVTALKTGPALGGTGTGNATGTLGTATTTTQASISLPLAIQVAALLGLGMMAARRKD